MRNAVWLRAALGAAAVVVIALSLGLSTCGCDQPRWIERAVLLSAAGAAFAVELLWGGWPRWAFALSVAVPLGWLIFDDNGALAGMLLLLMVGWTVFTGSLRDGLLAGGLSVFAVLGYVHFDTPERWLPWIAGIAATLVMMRLFVVQQTLVQQLRAAQADLERNAIATERRRIASEIHDVAAHALAMTVLHLTGLRLRVQREGGAPELVASLAQAERLGRQSLDDIRRTVGLLQDAGSGTAPPLPGAPDIPNLVNQYRDGGLDVELAVDGESTAVAPATGLALYRIVQESLANAVKHAPGSAVRVELMALNGGTHLSVRNARSGHASSTPGSGHGLNGMRERAELLGGHLRAGPDNTDWLVECTIPTRGDARPPEAEPRL